MPQSFIVFTVYVRYEAIYKLVINGKEAKTINNF